MMVIECIGIITGVVAHKCSPTAVTGKETLAFSRRISQPVLHRFTQARTALLEQCIFTHFQSERHVECHLNQTFSTPIGIRAERTFCRIIGNHADHPFALIRMRQRDIFFWTGKPRQYTAEMIGRRETVSCCQFHFSARSSIFITGKREIETTVFIMMRQKALKHVPLCPTRQIFTLDIPNGSHFSASFVITPVDTRVSRHDRCIGSVCLQRLNGRKQGHNQIRRFSVGKSYTYFIVNNIKDSTFRHIHAIKVIADFHTQTAAFKRKRQFITFHREKFSSVSKNTQGNIFRLKPSERHSLGKSNKNIVVIVHHLQTHSPIAPTVGKHFLCIETPAFHRQLRIPLHFATVVAPMIGISHRNTTGFCFHHLRIRPQISGIGIDKHIRPPVVRWNRLALHPVGNVDFTGFHYAALVSAMFIGLRFYQGRILGIAAAAYRHRLLPHDKQTATAHS